MIQHKENFGVLSIGLQSPLSQNAIDLEQNMSDTKWLYFCEQKKSTSITVESLSSGRSCSQVQTT